MGSAIIPDRFWGGHIGSPYLSESLGAIAVIAAFIHGRGQRHPGFGRDAASTHG